MTQGLHTQEVAVARSWDGRSQEGTLGFPQGGCCALQPPQTAALWRPQVRPCPCCLPPGLRRCGVRTREWTPAVHYWKRCPSTWTLSRYCSTGIHAGEDRHAHIMRMDNTGLSECNKCAQKQLVWMQAMRQCWTRTRPPAA